MTATMLQPAKARTAALRFGLCPDPECGHPSRFPLGPGVEKKLICGMCGAVYRSGDGRTRAPRLLRAGSPAPKAGTAPGEGGGR